MADNTTRRPCAIILTAIPVEYKAVRFHLSDLHEEIHPDGPIYERGIFTSEKQTWDVVIAEVGAGDVDAAAEAQKAFSNFRPELMFFVGVAGGLKDVGLGDVIVATKVYYYESGKANKNFETRPEIGNSSYPLVQRARAEARKPDWLQRLGSIIPESVPNVFVAPIAAGEKVVVSKRSATAKLITKSYGDAKAVEMEGYGVLKVAHANPVLALIIRGISDLIDDKAEADAANTQELAARHASAFAFEVLAKHEPKPDQEKIFDEVSKLQRYIKEIFGSKWEKSSDDSGGKMAQNKKDEDTGEPSSDTLNEEQQIVTFFTGGESKDKKTHLPETVEEFTKWFYGLGDYEQYYVLTTAVLHGAPVGEVFKRTDSFYRFIHDEVERRGNLLWSGSHQEGRLETQQRESLRFSDPLMRRISGRDLRKNTYTKTGSERGVERLYWLDADAYGQSTFGLHLLEFLCNEFISRGEFGQFFLNALHLWSNEKTSEVSRKATHSYGVVLWCHDVKELERIAKKWAIENNPKHTAELLDGAYEIYRVKSIEKFSDIGTSSDVLDLLKSWVKDIHKVLSIGEDESDSEGGEKQAEKKESDKGAGEKQAERKESHSEKYEKPPVVDESNREDDKPEVAIRLGCAVASTYALIGKRTPGIALERLGRLLKFPLSNSTIDLDEINDFFEACISSYVRLSVSGHIREVIGHLGASAEQLAYSRYRPLQSKKRHEYRQQRKIYLDTTLDAFFRVVRESLTVVPKIQNIRYSLSEPLPAQPILPDPEGRDVLLALLLSTSEVKCQEYITTLLYTTIMERESKLAFGLLRHWAEIVFKIRESKVTDAEEMYVIFLQFIVYLGRTVEKWCHDLEQQKLLSPPAFEIFKSRVKQWYIEGSFYSHPIGSLAREVLQQLGD